MNYDHASINQQSQCWPGLYPSICALFTLSGGRIRADEGYSPILKGVLIFLSELKCAFVIPGYPVNTYPYTDL
jgi:hypothetical protein